MPPKFAVVHYCEGAGHATRMLAIANALERAGAEIHLAGGGVGSQFIDLNGRTSYEPTVVDFIGDYQNGTTTDVLTGSIPDSARRIRELTNWFRKIDPDAVVTDDMFAAVAAVQAGIPQYVIKHDMPGIYEDYAERLGAKLHCSFQFAAARLFFYPAVWNPSQTDPAEAVSVPPIALDGPNEDLPDDLDVIIVPSYYSDLTEVADQLTKLDKKVLNVGSEDWEPVPSLLPYLREANVIICSGYTTIMEAAVAGTPCIVLPATNEQDGVASRLHDIKGFKVVDTVDEIIASIDTNLQSPEYENGAPIVAGKILADLKIRRESTQNQSRDLTRRRALHMAAAIAGVSIAGTTAVSAADGRKPYSFRHSQPITHSLGRTDTALFLQQYQIQYEIQWPLELRELPVDRFEGATVNSARLDELYKRITRPVTIHTLQITVTLENSTADYRHWLWMGIDTTNASVQTGVFRSHLASLTPQQLRLSFIPNVNTIEQVNVYGGSGTSKDAYMAFAPDEALPEHPAGRPPAGAASVIWHGTDTRVASLLGVFETSTLESTTRDEVQSKWEFSVACRPAEPLKTQRW